MPRNPGTGVYSKPSPDVITSTTIESTVYNTFVGDVETDLNLPRPVSSCLLYTSPSPRDS